MEAVFYLAFSLILLAFVMGLYKLWRASRRMSMRDDALAMRMMEEARQQRKQAREKSAESNGSPDH